MKLSENALPQSRFNHTEYEEAASLDLQLHVVPHILAVNHSGWPN